MEEVLSNDNVLPTLTALPSLTGRGQSGHVLYATPGMGGHHRTQDELRIRIKGISLRVIDK